MEVLTLVISWRNPVNPSLLTTCTWEYGFIHTLSVSGGRFGMRATDDDYGNTNFAPTYGLFKKQNHRLRGKGDTSTKIGIL